jgi:uncharacterized protein YjlB
MRSRQTGKIDERLNVPNLLSFMLQDDGRIPNSKFPLLIYQSALKSGERSLAALFEELFAAHKWAGTWRDGIYTYHHYHSTAHEVLGVFSGSATVQLGGERGVKHKLTAGDVVIIPAGVAHKNFGASSDFGVVGAYPKGQQWDMNYGRPDERPEADQNIARVALPEMDPIYGPDGPLLEHWLPHNA